MDVEELLSYKPADKREVDDEDDDVNYKKPRYSSESSRGDTRFTENEMADIVRQMDDESANEAKPLDEIALKKILLHFEKKILKNQELRIKFPDAPQKFMESEVDLNEVIQEMHVVATQPELYHVLVELNAVHSLMGLLGHENTDIAIAVVDLLQELTDVDTLHESDGADILLDALLEGHIVSVLVQNLDRLDETVKEESEGVHNSLAIIENVIEFRPDVCVEAGQQGLMQWLLKRLKARIPFDGNKLYCSEILSILLQNHEESRQLLGELEGIDVLLQQLAYFKRHDPSSTEEQELMENYFNSLCSSLLFSRNREKFLKGEGIQLMNLMLREKKLSRHGALKVLDFAMSNPEGADNCNKFVDILGLRTVFPLFLKTPMKYRKKGISVEAHEEHVCSIISSMLKNCKGTQRQRLLNKFTENDHEKVDRLMELHFRYLEKVQTIDAIIEREKSEIFKNGEEIESDQEDEFYIRRLDHGLFTLQLTDFIVMEICASGAPTVKQRVMQMLNLRGGSIKTIRNIMREYAGNIGNAKNEDVRELEQQRILQLVDKF
ncbi:Beta-catenin-like protein 1 [Chamberlinius hualienensis]